jgi:hypothetical protein
MSDENPKTLYPKMVYPHGPSGNYVIVKDAKEEMEVMGVKKQEAAAPATNDPNQAPAANQQPPVQGWNN